MRLLDGLIELGVVALLCLAPIPYGAVVPWAGAAVEGGVALLVGLVLVRMLVAGELTLRWSPLLAPGAAMLAVGVAQLVVPGLGSVNRWVTWEGLRLYLAYLGLALVLGAHLTTRGRVQRLVVALTAWGAALAGVGLAGRALGRPLVPWLRGVADPDRLTATLANPNHQALHFALVFFLGLGLLLRPARRTPGVPPGAAVPRPGGARIREAAGGVLVVAALALLGAALLLTLSRGGLLGVLAGLVVVTALALRERLGTGAVLAALLVGAGVLGGLAVVAQPVLDRMAAPSRDPLADVRWAVYDRTLRMASEAPLLGFGLGTYADAFTRFQPPGVPAGKVVDHAHNDYLQLAAETGAAGVGALAWALVGLGAFALPRWLRRHDPWVRGLVLGGLGALTAVAVHSALDFGLRIPSNALLTVAAAALVVNGAALRTQRGSGGGVDLPVRSWALRGWRRAGGLAAVGAGLALAGLALVPAGLAGWQARVAEAAAGTTARDAGRVTMADLGVGYRALGTAVGLQPRDPALRAARATVAEEIAVRVMTYGLGLDGRRLPPDPRARLGTGEEYLGVAVRDYRAALAANPLAARLHDRYAGFLTAAEGLGQRIRGSARLRVSDPAVAALVEGRETVVPEALAHYREAVRLDPQNPYRHRNLGVFALTWLRGEEAARVAAPAFRAALDLQPRLLEEVIDRLEASGADRGALAAAVPPRDDVWLAAARLWDARRRPEGAAWAFEQALAHGTTPGRQAEVRLAYAGFLLRGNRAAEALEQARQALVLEPRRQQVFVTLGQAYEALGQWSDAAAALASAVSVADDSGDPGRAVGARDLLASFHQRRGQIDEAIAVRREILERRPRDGGTHFQIGRLHEARGDWAGAQASYEQALELAPGDAELRRHVAYFLARRGRGPEGVVLLERVVAADPGFLEGRIALGDLYAQLGERERAAAQYREVLARRPGHDGARRALRALEGPGGSVRGG
jgi:tetratricopeptide (TPR) repeat protein